LRTTIPSRQPARSMGLPATSSPAGDIAGGRGAAGCSRCFLSICWFFDINPSTLRRLIVQHQQDAAGRSMLDDGITEGAAARTRQKEGCRPKREEEEARQADQRAELLGLADRTDASFAEAPPQRASDGTDAHKHMSSLLSRRGGQPGNTLPLPGTVRPPAAVVNGGGLPLSPRGPSKVEYNDHNS
jgi:hypothetical protein